MYIILLSEVFPFCLLPVPTHCVQLGVAEERAPGPAVAGPAGEETALPHSTHQLPPLPHHGDQPQGMNIEYR